MTSPILLTKQKFLFEKGNKWNRAACAFNKDTTRKTEKKKRNKAFSQLDLVFKYFADCANLSILVICVMN